ncbi:uncharacterized protein VICG_01688 [Vittaforma corneae ATCC 50505]|uniref:Upf1 domain-containing protein n=1 Tax=Vittaforma corneae (strain ATCC 50505) TaxID=993615 RepID=L2GLD0_VITCO|nr:uncharacterized protein VICG_01688 [Vittaforma corneae ATCC 50505]ELA41315.1 hypothetical protein VICG_01688 [Vittaforma corneae ATCC 50505]
MEFINKCKYCNKETLIKCTECSHGFCNDITDGKSHIIYHLVKSKHKRVSILDKDVVCIGCGENNLFRLGLAMDSDCRAELLGLLSDLNLNSVKDSVTEESESKEDVAEESTEGLETSKTTKSNAMTEIISSPEVNEAIDENIKLTNESFDQHMKLLNDYSKQLPGILTNIYCGHCKDLPKIVGEKLISFYPSVKCSIELQELRRQKLHLKSKCTSPQNLISAHLYH